jgi:hypothetical protein
MENKEKNQDLILVNNLSLKILLSFMINRSEYYEILEDPISKCLLDIEQIRTFSSSEKENLIFFFLPEKL